MPAREERFKAAIAAFDAENAKDPTSEPGPGGVPVPRALAQARRLSEWVARLAPDASEALELAARCQHLRRFEIPRSRYPAGRKGYLKWRSDLARFHAEEAAKILAEVGYDAATIARVRALNLKQDIEGDPETQILEDALCLEFLENGLEKFIDETDEEKIVVVLEKTWRKMGEAGRAAALSLSLSDRAGRLVGRALEKGDA
jgi:hypothetical protein